MMESPVTHTFEAGSGTNATLVNGSEVRIPADGLMDESGIPYTGTVNMSVRYMDPTAGNFGVLVPGGDMLARREDESTSVLYSYGILRVQMSDLSGQALQLSPGSKSTLIINIPPDQVATAPSTIPLWYFDEEKGVWQEEGSASREGDKYVGTVSHFTDWNCDDPTEGATIIGRLVDCSNNPAYGIVEFGQVTSDPQSSTETGESDGRFERRVPDGVQITVVISDPLMITPLTKDERGKVIVIVPPLSPGQVYDVGDIQTFPCPTQVSATFKLKAGDRIDYLFFQTDNGSKPVYNPGESMSVTLPPNITATMWIQTAMGTARGQEIQTPAENESLDLGLIDLTVEISEYVAIRGKNVCFGEIEGEGQISVSWTDDYGSNQINYTSPEPDGSFSIDAPLNESVEISSWTSSGTWKKTIDTPSTPGADLDLGTIEICENDQVSETSFRITGNGLDNGLFRIVSNENMQQSNMGAYYSGSDVTLAVVDDLEGKMYMGIVFPGNTTGLKTEREKVAVTIERQLDNTTVYYWGNLGEENESINFNVTRYDDVGGVIEGTFSGTFLIQDVNKEFTGETVEITEGKFSVVRYPDVQ
jgi:hypothetical protein